MNKRFFKIMFLGIFIPSMAFAQTDKTTYENRRMLAQEYINLNFPRSRNFDVQFEANFADDYKIKMPYYDYWEKGKMKTNTAVKVTGNIPILKKGAFSLAGGGSYEYRNIHFGDDALNTMGSGDIYHNRHEEFHTFNINATASYGTRLFEKSTFFTGTILADFSQDGFEHWGAIVTGTMILKSTEDEMMSVGLVGFINRTARLPIFPMFAYMKRLSTDWILDINFPGYCYVRRMFSKQGRFSVGANIDGHHFYIEPSGGELRDKSLYLAKAEIKAGVMYEQRVDKHLFFTIKGGYTFPFRSKIYDTDRLMRDELGKYSEDPNFYINIGISYNY